MPESEDGSWELATVHHQGKMYVSVDDLIGWLKDTQNNGLNTESVQWIVKSLVICKNENRHTTPNN